MRSATSSCGHAAKQYGYGCCHRAPAVRLFFAGFTVDTCVASAIAAEETPSFRFLPIGEKVGVGRHAHVQQGLFASKDGAACLVCNDCPAGFKCEEPSARAWHFSIWAARIPQTHASHVNGNTQACQAPSLWQDVRQDAPLNVVILLRLLPRAGPRHGKRSVQAGRGVGAEGYLHSVL